MFATDIADYLVKKGVPFRDSHEIVGRLTAHSVETGTAYPHISLKSYRKFSEHFDESVFDLFDIETALAARTATGAPTPDNVAGELDRWERQLK